MLIRYLPQVHSCDHMYREDHPSKHHSQGQLVYHNQPLQISGSKFCHQILVRGGYIHPSTPNGYKIHFSKPIRQYDCFSKKWLQIITFCVAGTRKVGTLTFLPCIKKNNCTKLGNHGVCAPSSTLLVQHVRQVNLSLCTKKHYRNWIAKVHQQIINQ